MLNNLDEEKLSKENRCVKVRAFPGSRINDIFSHIGPLLEKSPSRIIVHVGTNDAVESTSDEMMAKILDLRSYILDILGNVPVIISQPIFRSDNGKANCAIRNLNNKLGDLKIPLLDNSNIEEKHLGKKGLHLNSWGVSRLAMNCISLLRKC